MLLLLRLYLLLLYMLLLNLLRVWTRLGLVRPTALINVRRLLGGGGELLLGTADILLCLIKRQMRRMTVARRALRKLLSVLSLGHSLGDRLQRGLLSLDLERLL